MRNSGLLRGWPSFTLNMRRPPCSTSPFSKVSFASLAIRFHQHGLFAHQLLDQRLPFVVLVRRDRRRPADDKRRARFVDQDGIDFIDDRIVISALHLLLARRGHAVVAQVIETEFAVRSVGNVAGVLLAPNVRRLIVLNAADREPEKIVKLPHPFRIATGQIIVHRHEMRAASGQRVEIKRQGRDQSLAFARRHFGDAAAMQNHSADQLHIEVHHVPGHRLIADRETYACARSAGALRFSPPRTLPAKSRRAFSIDPPGPESLPAPLSRPPFLRATRRRRAF